MNLNDSQEFLSGALLGLLLLLTTWIAISKVHQMKLPGQQQTLATIFVLGLKLPLYIWVIIEGSYFSFAFWIGWGTIYLLLFTFVIIRSLYQVQTNK